MKKKNPQRASCSLKIKSELLCCVQALYVLVLLMTLTSSLVMLAIFTLFQISHTHSHFRNGIAHVICMKLMSPNNHMPSFFALVYCSDHPCHLGRDSSSHIMQHSFLPSFFFNFTFLSSEHLLYLYLFPYSFLTPVFTISSKRIESVSLLLTNVYQHHICA